jgi:hypothetical protein
MDMDRVTQETKKERDLNDEKEETNEAQEV